MDRLHRYSFKSFNRVRDAYPGKSDEWILENRLRTKIDEWFPSKTFRMIAIKMYNNLVDMLDVGEKYKL